jgi:putative RNA 2'-phosphotransferase
MGRLNEQQLTKISRFLSFVLRHRPTEVGLTLDREGWLSIDELIAGAKRRGVRFDRLQLETVVATNNKQRFTISSDGQRIRANQGHSVTNVDLNLRPIEPPAQLFHGTVGRFLASIRRQGLLKGNRQHVHLSEEPETARQVGARRGKPLVLTINAAQMHRSGHAFFRSANGVWLVDHVPPEFIL